MTSAELKPEVTPFWTVPREWEGRPCYIIGGGSSLSTFDFNRLKGRYVIGCNDAFRLGPEIVSYAIFGDSAFFTRNSADLMKTSVPLVTCSPALCHIRANVRKLKREMVGLHNGDTIGWNHSTGAMAINLAVSLGASAIYLLGFDMSNLNGRSHWHNHGRQITQAYSFKRFQQGFARVKADLPAGCLVFNVTDGSSRLESFDRITFEQFYQRLQQGVE